MKGLYVCAFEDGGTLSYLNDWLDTFASRDFDVFNAMQAGRVDFARICATLPRYDVIVLGYSCYYGLQGRRHRYLAALSRISRAVVVGFLQNEFRNFAEKVGYFDDFGVDILVSQLPEPVAREFYVGRTKARKIVSVYHGLFTGTSIDAKPHRERRVDIGSRLYDYAAYLGNYGRAVAVPALLDRLRSEGRFVIDWETDPAQRFEREDWLNFLAGCRLTIAAEAGSFFIQWNETKRHQINAHQRAAPGVSFQETYELFLRDDPAHFCGATISPRHFDAVHARTCQVLVEGKYNGVLNPGEHYIELKKDASNLDEVLEKMSDTSLCEDTARRAYDHVIEAHTLDHRVEQLFREF